MRVAIWTLFSLAGLTTLGLGEARIPGPPPDASPARSASRAAHPPPFHRISLSPSAMRAGRAPLALRPAGGTPLTLQDGLNGYTGEIDTYLDRYDTRDNATPGDTVEGHQTFLDVRWYPTDGSQEDMLTLMQFDLSAIPSNATVTSAQLQLYSLRANLNTARSVLTLSQVTGAWNDLWTWTMGVPTTVATSIACPSTVGLSLTPAAPESYLITGMESLVQTWVATPASNLGLMLSTNTELEIRFCSARYTPAQYCPALTVDYTTGAPPPTISVTSAPTTSNATPITVTGTASASGSATVSQVTWMNAATGDSGTASGTTSWTASIPLVNGTNPITFTVTDSLGDTGTASISVRDSPPFTGGGGSGHKSPGLKCGATGLEPLLCWAVLVLGRGFLRTRRRLWAL